MAKLTLSDLSQLTSNEQSAIGVINANSTAIETALENTLSRDGTSPNTMGADLDMNSNNILNLPYPASDTEPVRLGDIEDLLPTWFSQNAAPDTDEPEGSLWIDADSTDKDIYQLIGGVWTDTGIDIKGEQGATGATGAAGSNGSNGTDGADGTSVGVDFNFDSSTSDADPGAGNFRLNNATLASVTNIYIDNTDANGNTVTSWLDSFDDSTNTSLKGILYIRGVDDPTDFLVANVTGTIVDGTGYRKVPVTVLASGGTWTAAQKYAMNFAPAGNKGTDGAGSGDVVGPASATDNALVRFDGTTGKLVQDSAITVADTTGVVTGAVFPNTGLKVQDTNASHNLIIAPGSDLTADHTLTVTTGDADRTLTISGNSTVSQDYSSSGSPQFTGIELGHATDTTITRTGAGAIAVEGVEVALNSTSLAHTAGTIELGHATDTTLSRSSAGVLAVEGVTVPLNSTSSVHTASTIQLGHATDTTLSRSAAGVLAVEGVDVKPHLEINSQSAAYTAVIGNANEAIYHPSSDNNARTFTIPANSSVAYPVGTTLTFINEINTVTIAITTDTLTLAGSGSTGSRTLAANGIATAVKVASTKWVISGVGLT